MCVFCRKVSGHIGYYKMITDNILKDYIPTSELKIDLSKILDEGFI
jgi:hypothetical protein